jgi:hypothetical protein
MERLIIDVAVGDGAAVVALLVACVAAWLAVRDALRRVGADHQRPSVGEGIRIARRGTATRRSRAAMPGFTRGTTR